MNREPTHHEAEAARWLCKRLHGERNVVACATCLDDILRRVDDQRPNQAVDDIGVDDGPTDGYARTARLTTDAGQTLRRIADELVDSFGGDAAVVRGARNRVTINAMARSLRTIAASLDSGGEVVTDEMCEAFRRSAGCRHGIPGEGREECNACLKLAILAALTVCPARE